MLGPFQPIAKLGRVSATGAGDSSTDAAEGEALGPAHPADHADLRGALGRAVEQGRGLGGAAGPEQEQRLVVVGAGRQVCTAVTNAGGQASCGLAGFGWLQALLGGGFTARYAGNGTYLPSTDTAGLV